MKKIIGAAALAVAVAGLATADVKVSMNGRLRPNFFGYQEEKGNANGERSKKTSKTWWDNKGYGAFEDTLKFAFTSDDKNAGLTFSVNVKSDNALKDDNTINTSGTASGSFFTLSQYDIWSKVFGTDLVIGAGSWKDGWLDGAYRVNKDVNAINAEGLDWERFKLGSAFANAPSLFVDDIGNFFGGSSALVAYAEYPLALNDDMSLKLTAAAVKSNYYVDEHTHVDEDGTKKTHNTYYRVGGTGRVQFNMKNMLNSEFIVKAPSGNLTVLALYVQPKMLDALDGTLGGSYTIDHRSNGQNVWNGAWDVDLRLRYQVTQALSITSYNKISGLHSQHTGGEDTKTKNRADAKVSKGIAGLDGSGGQLTTGTDITTVMWNNLSGLYAVNDSITASLNVGLMTVLDTASNSKSDYGLNLRITPGVALQLSKPAQLWVGCSYSTATYNRGGRDEDGSKYKDYTVTSFSIPAIFRVKL